MITGAETFVLLLEADPSFQEAWDEHCAEYADVDGPMHYLALADLSRHILGKIAASDTGRLDAVFDVVERWHVEGDKYVREAATIGLLESLQNTNVHKGTTPEQVIPWLRPVSRRFWDKVEAFWERGEIITDD